QGGRTLHPELHQVDQVRPTTEELGVRMIGQCRQCSTGLGRGQITELPHRDATSSIAATMFTYAPQRHRLPDIRSWISPRFSGPGSTRSSLTALGQPEATSSSTATAEQIC